MIEVWIEGYAVTGESQEAFLMGRYEAESFDEAVKIMLKEKGKEDYKCINSKHYIWACRLFDNETDARKKFG